MRNWTDKELHEYKEYIWWNVLWCVEKSRKKHSPEASKVTNDITETMVKEYIKVNKEIFSREKR